MIPFIGMSNDLESKFKRSLEQLNELKIEIKEKQKAILEKNQNLLDKAHRIIAINDSIIDRKDLEQSKQSISQYNDLLENVIKEISAEIEHFSQYASQDKPTLIIAWQNEPDTASEFFASKIKWIRKYIKSVRKNLMVSFSRYNFGFENQSKRLSYAEHLIEQLGMNKEK